jgi:hypothetical protein
VPSCLVEIDPKTGHPMNARRSSSPDSAAEEQRREQLARWHADEHPIDPRTQFTCGDMSSDLERGMP